MSRNFEEECRARLGVWRVRTSESLNDGRPNVRARSKKSCTELITTTVRGPRSYRPGRGPLSSSSTGSFARRSGLPTLLLRFVLCLFSSGWSNCSSILSAAIGPWLDEFGVLSRVNGCSICVGPRVEADVLVQGDLAFEFAAAPILLKCQPAAEATSVQQSMMASCMAVRSF
jgi:hypothetical protein